MPTKTSIIKYALANSLWTAFYITLVGLFFHSAPDIFSRGPDSALIPVVMLLLFVLSATICASLMLGRPVLWYLDGRKKEALTLFGYTLLFFFVATIIMGVALYLVSRG